MDQKICGILLIDDDEDDYFLLRQRLPETRNVKFTVEWAHSFQAGWDAMQRKTFDAILVDYRIGDSSGIELLRKANEQHYPAPILLLTGQGNYEVDLEAMQAGAADYLTKAEINSSLLERSIRYAIERKQQEQALLESESRFRIALSTAEIAVFSTDQDLRYTWFYSATLGNPSEQIIGKRDDELLPAENVASLMALKRRVLEQRRSVREEIQIQLPSGPKTFVISIEPYYDLHGNTLGVIGAYYDVTDQRKLEHERREHDIEKEIQHRLTEYREQERQAIARELHDRPVQNLSSLIFSIQYIKEVVSDTNLQLELERIRAKLRETVQDLRSLMNEMRPPALIRFGLAKMIQFHLEGFRENHPEFDIEHDLNLLDEEEKLSEQVNMNLFRIYHEAMNNILHHAQATKIKVHLGLVNEHLVLEVQDNGIGLPELPDLANHIQNNHFGLVGMKERAEMINGELQIISNPHKGTVIKVIVPVSQQINGKGVTDYK